jgi:tetratricopeptide (TPR) repeat protein
MIEKNPEYAKKYPLKKLYEEMAEDYNIMREASSAQECYLKCLELGNDSLKVNYGLGLAYDELRDPATANKYYKKVISKWSKSKEAKICRKKIGG